MSTDEHLVAIVSFEGALKREIKRVRRELAKLDSLPYMRLVIQASGRLHDGDMKLTYSLSDEYSIDTTKGDAIQPVIDEFMRRHGWQAIHAPKAIGYSKVPDEDMEPMEPEPVEGPLDPDDPLF